jgi:hypothetical protein
MNEDKKKVFADVADTLTDKPTILRVDILYPNRLQRFLMFFRLMKPYKTFKIYAACMASMIRISKLLLDIDPECFKEKDSFLRANWQVMNDSGRALCEVIAIAIKNKEEEPTEQEILFFLNNLTAAEVKGILNIILHKINVQDFMFSIVSVTGMNLINPKG